MFKKKKSVEERITPTISGTMFEYTEEKDPLGLIASAAGAKFDADKVDVSLLTREFAESLWEVAKVGTHGKQKYSRGGWLSVPDAEVRYLAAEGRHRLLESIEGDFDKKSGMLHAAHAAWNALAYLHFRIQDLKEKGYVF